MDEQTEMLVLPIHEEVKSVWQSMLLSDIVYSENNKRIDILPKKTAEAVKRLKINLTILTV